MPGIFKNICLHGAVWNVLLDKCDIEKSLGKSRKALLKAFIVLRCLVVLKLMVLKWLDEVCEYLFSKMSADESVGLDEIKRILRDFRLADSEVDLALDFLERYFLELDDSRQIAKLTPSLYSFYTEISRSDSRGKVNS